MAARVEVALLVVTVARVLTVPLEAAFQGRCENGNPCEQNCFNLHDFMYECDCNEGFYLSSNGYTCLGYNSSLPITGGNTGATIPSSPSPAIAIQIEVDIDPPEEAADGLSREQLERLGLPSHHIHYRAGDAATELLNPKDIQVSYTEDRLEEEEGERRGGGRRGGEGVSRKVEEEGEGELEPPRALPSTTHLERDKEGLEVGSESENRWSEKVEVGGLKVDE